MLAGKRCHILLVHPDDESVFTLDGLNLPACSYSLWSTLDMLDWNLYVQESLNLPSQVVFLRGECGVSMEEMAMPYYLLHIFEVPRTVSPAIDNVGKWVSKQEVHQLRVESGADLVFDYLQKYSIHGLDINTDGLDSFSKPGWFDRTSAWSMDVLSKKGFLIEYIQPLRKAIGSCLLLARSQCGLNFYIKRCLPTGIYNELAIFSILSSEMPDSFWKPLAVDIEHNLLVMNDYGPTLETAEDSMSSAQLDKRILTTWGKIQLAAVPKCEQLTKGGVPVWDTEKFRILLEEMLEYDNWWSYVQEHVSEDKYKYDRETFNETILARFDYLSHKIGEYQVPFSLVHGDLNISNVILREDSELGFLDFAYLVWSFPFLDLWTSEYEKDEVEYYLEFWSEYESMDRLKELYNLIDDFKHIYTLLRFYHWLVYTEKRDQAWTREMLIEALSYVIDDIDPVKKNACD